MAHLSGCLVPRVFEKPLQQTGAVVRHGGNQAYYTTGADYIQIPPFEAFRDAESYYATLSHETTHWRRHPSRIDRNFGRKRFGDERYAAEALVAELGSAFLCADLSLTPEVRVDHTACIAARLKVLKNDKRAVFIAAAQVQRAVGFLHGLQDTGAESAAAWTAARPRPLAGAVFIMVVMMVVAMIGAAYMKIAAVAVMMAPIMVSAKNGQIPARALCRDYRQRAARRYSADGFRWDRQGWRCPS